MLSVCLITNIPNSSIPIDSPRSLTIEEAKQKWAVFLTELSKHKLRQGDFVKFCVSGASKSIWVNLDYLPFQQSIEIITKALNRINKDSKNFVYNFAADLYQGTPISAKRDKLKSMNILARY